VPAGKEKLIITLEQLAKHQPLESFEGAEHWVNHLQFNPGGTRFVFLHRWKKPGAKSWQTRMFTAKPDGSDLKILHDTGMISHFDWRDDGTMLAWVKVKKNEPRNAFCLLHLDGKPPEIVFESETVDGHCSYSPDRKWVLNDTYPDKDRMQHLMLLNVKTGRKYLLNKFHSPKQFTGPFRCDLHPRWNRDGTQICFDGCHGDRRQMYVVDVKDIVS
jgi:Tol biopolymer transport system component